MASLSDSWTNDYYAVQTTTRSYLNDNQFMDPELGF